MRPEGPWQTAVVIYTPPFLARFLIPDRCHLQQPTAVLVGNPHLLPPHFRQRGLTRGRGEGKKMGQERGKGKSIVYDPPSLPQTPWPSSSSGHNYLCYTPKHYLSPGLPDPDRGLGQEELLALRASSPLP